MCFKIYSVEIIYSNSPLTYDEYMEDEVVIILDTE